MPPTAADRAQPPFALLLRLTASARARTVPTTTQHSEYTMSTAEKIYPGPHVQTHHELVTPERAAELLQLNTRNRPVVKPYVRQLRRELEEGRWKETHQGIAVSKTGRLLDGQHRLLAIAESGISAPLQISENVDDDAFDAIDQHTRRTGAQILAMAGVTKDGPRLVAMARAILQVVHGSSKVSNTAAAEYVVAHQTELELFLAVARGFSPAVGAAFAWCATLGWSETIPAAERLVNNGPWEEPQETDPMRALVNRSKEFHKLGAGAAGIKGRFDVALNCLQALHEGRGLRVARSYRPDYAKLQSESMPPEDGQSAAPRRTKSLKSLMADSTAQSRIDYDVPFNAEKFNAELRAREEAAEKAFLDEPDVASITITGASSLPPVDPAVAEAVEAEVTRSRRRPKD